MNQPTRASSARSWRRSTTRAVVIGALATMFVASAASAAEPYEPDESQDNGEYDDHGDNDVAGNSGNIDTSGPNPEHPPIANDVGCSTIHDGDLDTDVVKLLDEGIDFGDSTWVVGAPFGVGSVQWSVECGLYSADVVGTLHLDGESDRSGRVHVSFWNAGELQETRHSRTRTAPDNGHHSWPVNLSSPSGVHTTEVRVCTEISDDGVDFDSVNCKTRYMG